ncbi:MAG: hypothetical protein ACWA5Q_00670 [bacterium]
MIRLLLPAVAAIAITTVSFAYLDMPFVWSMIVWSVAAIVTAVLAKSDWLKVIAISALAGFVVLGGYEGYLQSQHQPVSQQFDGTYTLEYSVDYGWRAKALGYAPIRNKVVTSRLTRNQRTLYDVKYSIGEDGLRVTSPFEEDAICVLFFGGSFTFGEGVNDDESMPYQVGLQSEGAVRAYNFGFHGYGPHQMLSALQLGVVDKTIECEPQHVVYQMITSHVKRVVGLSSWDKNGPRYELDQDGAVNLLGRFGDPEFEPSEPTWFRRQLDKILLYPKLFGRWDITNAQGITLMTAIVDESIQTVAEKYPDADFHIVIWDSNRFLPKEFVAQVDDRARQHMVTEFIPDFIENQTDYRLGDGHPSALAHHKVAKYLVENVLLD